MAERLTVADIRAQKGKHQFTMVRTEDWETLEAAERAGVEMVSVTPEMMVDPRFREMAPTVFAVPGVDFFELGTADDFTRWAFRMLKATADAVYVSAGLPTIRQLAADNIPVISHVGLIPSRATWTGGFKAVGKTADQAMQVYRAAKALEEAGAFGAEIEVVPAEMAAEISKRTSLFMVSMEPARAGTASTCSPRTCWARTVGTFRATPRSTATSPPNTTSSRRSAWRRSRSSWRRSHGAYPDDRHIVGTDPAELEAFRRALALAGEG